jgi:glycyl-tRNA synthetase beta subunit
VKDGTTFLEELDKKNQLATSSKDPFGSKAIVDKIIEVILKYNLEFSIEEFSMGVVDLFRKRIRIYFNGRFGDYVNKLSDNQEKIFNFIWRTNETLVFLEENYEKLKFIMHKISYTENIKLTGGYDYTFDLYRNKQSLLVQMQFIENILKTNNNIFNNSQYIYIFQGFYRYINSIVKI